MICIMFCKTMLLMELSPVNSYGKSIYIEKWLIFYIDEWTTRNSSEQFVLYKQIQKTFSDSSVWSFARHNPGMLRACFFVAQLIAYMSSTESTCSRCGNVDICTNLTEHILINCAMIQTCKKSFERIVVRHFDYTVCNLLRSLNGQEYMVIYGLCLA